MYFSTYIYIPERQTFYLIQSKVNYYILNLDYSPRNFFSGQGKVEMAHESSRTAVETLKSHFNLNEAHGKISQCNSVLKLSLLPIISLIFVF